jgi:hypothetical protein
MQKLLFTIMVWLNLITLSIAGQNNLPVDNTEKYFPYGCESNANKLDKIRNEAIWGIGKEGVLIAIARLGKGEQSRELNRRRLYNVRVYLRGYGVQNEKLIIAEGERINSYGRVEFYLGGKLLEVLSADRGKDLCVECCAEDDRFYPNKKGKKQK